MKKVKKILKKYAVLLVLLLLVGVNILPALLRSGSEEPEDVPFATFMAFIENEEVTEVTLNSTEPTLTFVTGQEDKNFITDNPKSENFKRELLDAGVKVTEIDNSAKDTRNLLIQLSFQLLTFALMIGILMRVMNKGKFDQMKTSENGVPGIDFSSIAGNEEAKAEMAVLVDFLKSPKRFNDRGANLPKGTVFYGPPGTGKTLMAKAVAGEAGVPFISISGSDFIELYVGTGAKRVRELFKQARKLAPCIIFIDEIDAVGGNRGANSNSEYKQTINALLNEMDGFNSGENIVVIAATNRLEDLDPALIRPGRFDKQVAINVPDKDDRLAILNVHTKDKALDESVDLKAWANTTIGFSGAELEALVNEAAILSVVNEHDSITQADMDDAHYKMIMKGHKKNNQKGRNKEELNVVAWHEAGHALIARLLSKSSVPKVSILSSTSGAGGVTFITPSDNALPSKKDLKQRIQMLYAGRIAESLLFDSEDLVTSGASQDIKEATRLIRVMLTELGMSPSYGMINPGILYDKTDDSDFLLKEAKELSDQLYNETKTFMIENKEVLERIAQSLLAHETITEKQLDEAINPIDLAA